MHLSNLQKDPKQGYLHHLSASESAMAYVTHRLLFENKSLSERPLVLLAKSEHRALTLLSQLTFFLKGTKILHFSDRGTMLYDSLSPREEYTTQRISILSSLSTLHKESTPPIVVLSVQNLLNRLPPLPFILGRNLSLEKGGRMDSEMLRTRLQLAGYRLVKDVMEGGEFSVKGSLFELFPMGERTPYRIEFFDTEIEDIRTYDPKNRS